MKIKAKQGYNIDLNDINVSLQASKGWIEIDDDLFYSSKDVKRLMKFIDIFLDTDAGDAETIKQESIEIRKPVFSVSVQKDNKGNYIVGTLENKTPNNVIIMDPNDELVQPEPKNIISSGVEKKKKVLKEEPAKKEEPVKKEEIVKKEEPIKKEENIVKEEEPIKKEENIAKEEIKDQPIIKEENVVANEENSNKEITANNNNTVVAEVGKKKSKKSKDNN